MMTATPLRAISKNIIARLKTWRLRALACSSTFFHEGLNQAFVKEGTKLASSRESWLSQTAMILGTSLFAAIALPAWPAQLTGVSISPRDDGIEISVGVSGPVSHAIKLGSGGLLATIAIGGLSPLPEPRRLDAPSSLLTSALIQPGTKEGEAIILLIAAKPMRL